MCLKHSWESAGVATGAYRKGNEPDGYYFFFEGLLESCVRCPVSRIVFFCKGLNPCEVEGPLSHQLSNNSHAAKAAQK